MFVHQRLHAHLCANEKKILMNGKKHSFLPTNRHQIQIRKQAHQQTPQTHTKTRPRPRARALLRALLRALTRSIVRGARIEEDGTAGRMTMKSTRRVAGHSLLRFARSLAPLTHSLAPHCSLRSRAPLRSLVHSLAHSLTPELMGK